MTATRIKRKSVNYSFKKVECWKCDTFYHQVIMTKYHGILCKKCYQALLKDAQKDFSYFVSALEIEFDSPLNDKINTLEDISETMHFFWKSYVVETNLDLDIFQKCYLEEVRAVKDAYETLEMLK